MEAARAKLNEAAERVHAADPTRPVASIWSDSCADLGATVRAMPLVDLWGVNAYRGDSFGQLFDQYRHVSALPQSVPLFIGEIGMDAYYHAGTPADGQSRQAAATARLARELHGRTADPRGGVAGGFVF